MFKKLTIAARTLLIVGVMTLFTFGSVYAQSPTSANAPIVRAVLFYDSQCPNCEYVREEVLPPLQSHYGDQLVMTQLEINDPRVYEVFLAALDQYDIPPEMQGVPFLIIGNVGLVGSEEIPEQFPGQIERYLTEGGVDYPLLSGLDSLIISPVLPGDVVERGPDPIANGLAIAIMVGMIVVLVYVANDVLQVFRKAKPERQRRSAPVSTRSWRDYALPGLALVGLGVAGYLAYVETTQTQAICGPVGDCNAVQSSPYARLWGILPIGVVGMVGYLAILIVWWVGRRGKSDLGQLSSLVLLGITLFGVIFSLYLTYLEPFVIGAVCAWCLTSAVIITALLLLVTPPALKTLSSIAISNHSFRMEK